MIPIVFHPGYQAPLPADHRFPMGKYAALAKIVQAEILQGGAFHAPEPAARADLIRAHAPDYVDAVLLQTVSPALERRIGLPITADVALRSRLACGGTLLAARLALRHGIACNTAGGSHHAARDGGAGFCVFNDVAVAALALLEEGAARRVLVIDLDVHQGDGTAGIFADDPRVFTFSLHCGANFPTRKVPGDLDVELPKGAGDDLYLEALSTALPSALNHKADLIFYNAGVDPHTDDRLGHLMLTDEGLAARDKMVFDAVRATGAPIVGVLGGGYGDSEIIARRHAGLHRAAAVRAQQEAQA